MSEEDDEGTTLVVAYVDPDSIRLLEQRLEESLHLRPMWERIRTGESDGRAFLGLPVASKVTQDTVENHARHLHSLLRLMDLPISVTFDEVNTVEVEPGSLKPLYVSTSEDS